MSGCAPLSAYQTMRGFPKMLGTFLGVPIKRIIRFCCILGSPYFGKLPCEPRTQTMFCTSLNAYRCCPVLGLVLTPKDVSCKGEARKLRGLSAWGALQIYLRKATCLVPLQQDSSEQHLRIS